VWNVGIKTAAAQNMVAVGFLEKQFGTTITWTEWFIAGAPFSALLPRVGVMDWKESQRGFPWGTVVLFAVGISERSRQKLGQTASRGY